jgi:uncharacterized OB-fold protein
LIQPIVAGGEPVVVGWAELVEQNRLLIVAPIEGVTAHTVRIGARLSLEWKTDASGPTPVFRAIPSVP